jgi:hypothetical protein
MSEVRLQPQNDDEKLEREYIGDYVSSGLLVNFRSLVVLLRAARESKDELDQKSICLSAWQNLLSSYEDFAMLLWAMIRRKAGKHLHHGLGFEKSADEGSTNVPSRLKKYDSPAEFLNTIGFDSLSLEALNGFGFDIPDEQTFANYYQDFAFGVREIGKYQSDYNDLKNRLKHGKAIISSGENEITFVTWNDKAQPAGWDRTHIETTIRQIEIAVIQTAKIYNKSLDFLCSFMMHYHAQHAQSFIQLTQERFEWCVQKVKELGLESGGLTNN